MKKVFFLIITISTLISCSEPFPYKYQNEQQVINCSNNDSKIMNEALYSFREDISKHFLKEIQKKDYLNFLYSYEQYIYRGAKGNLSYYEIVSDHTIKVYNELLKQDNLFIKTKGKSNLNYKNDFVQCLINSIKNKEMKSKIIELINVGYLSPDVMAENYRITTSDAETDPNFLMFIVLDTYYQRLLDLDIPNTNQ